MEESTDKITLTLSPEESTEESVSEVAQNPIEEKEEVKFDDSSLTEEEKKMVDEFAKQIDIMETSTIIQYGAGAQNKVADFSENALKNVKTKDLGDVGDMMSELIGELKGFEIEEEDNGIFGFFKKQANKVSNLKTRYDSAAKNVDKIAKALEDHQIVLMKDIAL